MAVINGTNGDDSLVGTADADLINGLGGTDTMVGGAGNDTLDGGDGIDTVDYRLNTALQAVVLLFQPGSPGLLAGSDGQGGTDRILNTETFLLGDGSDVLDASNFVTGIAVDGRPGNNTIIGGSGSDSFLGGSAADSLIGGGGDDLINGAQANDTILGGDGSDYLFGGLGDDYIDGGAGNDSLAGEDGNDTLLGGDGDDTFSVNFGNDFIDGGTGSDSITYNPFGNFPIVVSPILNDTVIGSYLQAIKVFSVTGFQSYSAFGVDTLKGVEIVTGTDGGDTISGAGMSTPYSFSGGAGNDLLSGGFGGDSLDGGAGNDVLIGRSGSNLIVGGAGADTLVFAGPRSAYSLSASDGPGNTGLISSFGTPYDSRSLQGTVTGSGEATSFSGIEVFHFSDGRQVYDPGDPIGQVERMYMAAIGRLADPDGLHIWTQYLKLGSSLTGLAEQFVTSPEFNARYPAVDNPGYVTLLYNNTLQRAPDAGGLADWITKMNAGLSRADMLFQFSESQEHYQLTSNLWSTGFFDSYDPVEAQVARLYDSSFGRVPDPAGWNKWTAALKDGTYTLNQLAALFPESAEFQQRYGVNVDNATYVNLLYQNTLRRGADPDGFNFWKGQLDSNASTRADMLLAFSESAEHVSVTTNAVDKGLLFV